MKSWEFEKVLKLLNEATKIALSYFDSPNREFKQDRSIVTQADREIETMLGREFDKPSEGVYLIGEETIEKREESYLENALKGTAWIIDPIDGTSSYANHLVSWGISIGFAERGKITEGAIYLPILGKLLITDGSTVYASDWRRDCTEDLPELKPFKPSLPKPPYEAGIIALDQDSTRRGHKLPGTIHATGSCVFSLLHLFMGAYISYISYAKLWDLAAGAALMDRLGFLGRFEDGRPFTPLLDPSIYELYPQAGNRRWKTKGRVVFSGSEETLGYTLNEVHKTV